MTANTLFFFVLTGDHGDPEEIRDLFKPTTYAVGFNLRGSTTQIYGKAWVVEDFFCLPRHGEARGISMVEIPAPGYPWLMVEC